MEYNNVSFIKYDIGKKYIYSFKEKENENNLNIKNLELVDETITFCLFYFQ